MTVMTDLPHSNNNNTKLPWLVLKFGGTSVGKCLDAITGKILKNALKTHRIVVVCSALSNNTKTQGTTSRLIRAASSVLGQEPQSHTDIINEILHDHLVVAEQHVHDPEILNEVKADITKECENLKYFLQAAKVIEEVSPRSRDIIIGTGERLACRVVTASLRQHGVQARYVNLDKLIVRRFDPTSLDQSFYDYLSDELAKTVGKCQEDVPVVTGFFGPVPGSLLSTVGRGYTDLTAALVAVGIQAQELQIWKEVDGIFTADPRKVNSARLLKIITPEEAAELTYYGSEVIHPFTMEQVIRAHIPIRIKNVKNPEGCGTLIFPDLGHAGGQRTPSPGHSPRLLLENGYHLDLSRRHPTAVTIKDNVVVLNIHSNRKSVSHGFFALIFSVLDKYGIVVDLISTSEVHVSMALGAQVLDITLQLAVEELSRLGTVDILREMAILSLVGKQMRNMVGIAGKMFHTLAEANINIEMISQGASEINISCVIHNSKAEDALRAIHDKLLAGNNISLVESEEVVNGGNSK